jgi:hypothetical protein
VRFGILWQYDPNSTSTEPQWIQRKPHPPNDTYHKRSKHRTPGG